MAEKVVDDCTTLPSFNSTDITFGSTDGVAGGMALVHNELICFLQNKSLSIPFDQLVKLCADFYTRDKTIVTATFAFWHKTSSSSG